jgi:hypothetical protein
VNVLVVASDVVGGVEAVVADGSETTTVHGASVSIQIVAEVALT